MQKFNEWMAFRQTVEQTAGDYNFIGTYNTESIPELGANSTPLSLEDSLKLIPKSFRQQFEGSSSMVCGKSHGQNNKELVWITNKDQEMTYIFEKVT